MRLERTRQWAPFGLAALFLVSGIVHLVRPETFRSLIPDGLPAPEAINAASGLAELVCAAGLLTRARWAGPASAILLVAVFPGNVTQAIAASSDPALPRWVVAVAWARLPLQIPLIWAALQARR